MERIRNTPSQAEALFNIIVTLTDWLDNGVPRGALVRIWRASFDENDLDCIDVSGGATFPLVWAYLNDWASELRQEEGGCVD